MPITTTRSRSATTISFVSLPQKAAETSSKVLTHSHSTSRLLSRRSHASRQPRYASRNVSRLNVQPPSVEEARSEEHTSELQSLMRISYAVFCLKKKKKRNSNNKK